MHDGRRDGRAVNQSQDDQGNALQPEPLFGATPRPASSGRPITGARVGGPVGDPLVDRFGRRIRHLRISITDRCMFRCRYCMPAAGVPWLARADLLTLDEFARLTRVMVDLGIEEVRLTGGEPTVRPYLPDLVRHLRALAGVRSVSLTTNGVLLRRLAGPLADAGLTRINVSLDSLSRERFAQLTRRDAFEQVMAGLEELERHPTISPIKINAVALRGVTEAEALDFTRLARRKPYVVRWIEFMPLDADHTWRRDDILTGAEVRSLIEADFGPLVPLEGTDQAETARRYAFADGIGEVGFITPVSAPFCAQCDRIRLTADGQLRTCLFAQRETDLRSPLRAGASDAELATLIRHAVWRKPLRHGISDDDSTLRPMSAIGG
jgi:cyclic pyranopterin phosphate synthase